MDKETINKILKAGFESDGENQWAKFDGNKEFYIHYSADGIKHIFAYAPLNEEGNQDMGNSHYDEKFFEELNLNWFNELDNEY